MPRTGFVEVARSVGAPTVPIVTRGAYRSVCLFEGEAIPRTMRMRNGIIDGTERDVSLEKPAVAATRVIGFLRSGCR